MRLPRSWLRVWGLPLVLAVSALVYVYSISGGLVWDDFNLVGQFATGHGPRLQDCFTRPLLGYFRPLVALSFYLDHLLWKQDPSGYHLTNILLHLFAVWTVYLLGAALFRRRSPALLGATLFAVHPAEVGAVAWIGGRTDALCACFTALFLLYLARAARTTGSDRRFHLALSTAAYLAAIFTKEQAIPLLLLVPPAFTWLPRGGVPVFGCSGVQDRNTWAATLPFGLAALLYLSLAPLVVTARPSVIHHSALDQAALLGKTAAYYALLLAVPIPRWMQTLSLAGLAGPLWAIGGWAALAGAFALLWRLHRTNPTVAWGLAECVLGLLAVINLVPLPYLQVAPYRATLSTLGLSLALAGTLTRRRRGFIPHPSSLILLLWWGGLTLWGVPQWHTNERFLRSVEGYDPGSLLAHYNLASSEMAERRYREAASELEATLRIVYRSDAWRTPEGAAQALRQDPAIEDRVRQNQDFQLPPRERLAQFLGYLGDCRWGMGDLQEAETAYRAALAVYPNYAPIVERLRNLRSSQ